MLRITPKNLFTLYEICLQLHTNGVQLQELGGDSDVMLDVNTVLHPIGADFFDERPQFNN